MAVVKKIGDYEFPSEIKLPQDEDINISWVNSEEVEILLAVTPYECPENYHRHHAQQTTRSNQCIRVPYSMKLRRKHAWCSGSRESATATINDESAT